MNGLWLAVVVNEGVQWIAALVAGSLFFVISTHLCRSLLSPDRMTAGIFSARRRGVPQALPGHAVVRCAEGQNSHLEECARQRGVGGESSNVRGLFTELESTVFPLSSCAFCRSVCIMYLV